MGREVRICMLEPRGGAWGHREGVGGNIGPRTKFGFFFNNRQNPNDMTKVSELLLPSHGTGILIVEGRMPPADDNIRLL